MAVNQLLLNQSLNDIMEKATKYEEYKNKYEELKKRQTQHTMNYSRRKREEKDPIFIQKQREYAKNYYIKNKSIVDKKNIERYYKKKNASSGEESE